MILKIDLKFKDACNFHILNSIPSEARLSRYFSKINKIDDLNNFYYELIDEAINIRLINVEK